jgi:hypothetical protein
MRKIIVLMLFMLPLVSMAQEAKKESPLKFYGFIRNDFSIDSYQGVNAFEDIYYLFPYYIGRDDNGNDINEQTTANFFSMMTRLGMKITGPEILGAKTSAVIEVDLAGKPNYFLMRARKAYVQFDWEKSSLLVGQTWHPLFGGHAYPRIGSLNTGTPFNAFNRSPQVKLVIKTGSLKLGLTGLYQHQYTSRGPLTPTTSSTYKRDAVLPEMVVSLDCEKNGVSMGVAADYNTIKPRLTTTGTAGTYNTDEILGSLTYMAYGKIAKGKLMMLAKGFYGQNMSHLLMLGGYGVKSLNPTTGKESYTNYNVASALFNITYGKKWRPGLFVGYSENLGTSDPLINTGSGATTYGFFNQIQSMYRISPSMTYSIPRFLLTAEYEMTSANYGQGNFNLEDGLYAEKHTVENNGLRLVMTYFF